MGENDLRQAIGEPLEFIGDAVGQVDRVTQRIAHVIEAHPDAARYRPSDIL